MNLSNPIANTFCGYVALIGRPNVGKSTLLNKILGQKISITAKKPQTTRHKILGIKTTDNYQTIYVDTPGLQQKAKKMLNRVMNKATLSTIKDVDLIVFVVEGTQWKADDELVLQKIVNVKCPVILAINKVDNVALKETLLTHIQELSLRRQFAEIIPISATAGTNIEVLEKAINNFLPQNPFFFPPEEITDRSERFLASEIIREKLTRFLGEEVPYSLSVIIDQFKRKEKILHIVATIIVEKAGQKAIVIGKDGENLKKIGTLARKDLEVLFAQKVFLQLWVKVKSSWSDDMRLLQSYGYIDQDS